MVSVLAITPLSARIDTLSADFLVLARHLVYGQRHSPEKSPVVVVALDERTYRTPPFAGTPKVMWPPHISVVLDAILAGGAKVVGFDLVFPASMESFLPGFERSFLVSLRNGSKSGRIVLGRVQHQDEPISPFPAQIMAVGSRENLRALNVVSDVDDVVRHAPLFFQAESKDGLIPEPSMSLELAARALGVRPDREADGRTNLAGYSIPGSERNAMRINFQGGDDIPTHSLADLYARARNGDQEYFAGQFRDKVVLIGTVLDVEDRRLTAKRFASGSGGGWQAGQDAQGNKGGNRQVFRRDTIPGVYIHAAAINDLLRGDALRELVPLLVAALAGSAGLLVTWFSFRFSPAKGLAFVVTLAAAWTLTCLVAMQAGLVLPIFSVIAAIVTSCGSMLAYRYAVTDRQKNRIRKLFALYLTPALVSRMENSSNLPELGGEMREITVWFSDLASFATISEGLSPGELVSLMNRYFSMVTGIIEDHGGFVDKYIGDAVVAVFGAPVDDPHHAGQAVAAALTVKSRLAEMNEAGAFDGLWLTARTGINTGSALVGNVGSDKRFNYTVMGDAVNLASRLEGANKATGTAILVSEYTVDRLPESIVSREIGMIRVKGRHAPIKVFEPLAMRSARGGLRTLPAEEQAQKAAQAMEPPASTPDMGRAKSLARLFAEALRLYRSRRFSEAALLLEGLAGDQAAVRLRARALAMDVEPPPPDWDGVDTLLEK